MDKPVYRRYHIQAGHEPTLKEVFGDVGPAATMILGVRFVSEEMKVEIEADAVAL